MKNLAQKLFDIRENEGQKSFLMFGYIFLIIASLMIVKPVRNSLFLVEFGVAKLPYVFILTALFAALLAWFYSRFTKTARFNYTIVITLLISIASLFLFWFLFRIGYRGGWLLYAFYIWVGIFGLITSAQFWLLSSFVFDAREAKRLFGFIGAGAITGGIVGGYLTNYLAPRLRTENLIFFCIGFLVICIALFWLIWNKSARAGYRDRTHRERISSGALSSDNPVKLLVNSRHLAYLAGLIGISVVVANFVDYQFSAAASRWITDTDRLTAFFGFWMSTLNFMSLGVQLVLTGKVMKNLGVAASLFFLPLGILLGAVATLIHPGLGSAILIKVSDGSFKHSINKAGMELLALPTPVEVKKKIKAFIDVSVDNFATGLAGALLIFFTVVLGFSGPQISFVIIALIALWIYLILRVRGEYINAFRTMIEKRSIDFNIQSLNLEDASVLGSLVRVLEGDNERQILYVLQLIENVQNQKLIPHLKKLITNPSNEVKARVMDMALRYDELDLTSEANELISSDDEFVRIEAIRYLCKRSDNMVETLNRYQNHNDYRIRSGAMMCAARAWKEERQVREVLDLKGLLVDALRDDELPTDEMERYFVMANAARVIGLAGDPELYPQLDALLHSDSQEVVRAAVISAGQTRSGEFISTLIGLLNTPGISGDARHSLAEYGEEIVDTLDEQMEDPETSIYIRRRIPRVLSEVGSQSAADILLKNLDHKDLFVRYEVLKGLNKLKSNFPHIKTDKSLIEKRILYETRQYYRYSTILTGQKRSQSLSGTNNQSEIGPDKRDAAGRLLLNALRERLVDNLERIFRLLGLRYIPDDMYNAYYRVTSKNHRLRAAAIEFLDNVLKTELKRVIVPIIESNRDDDLTNKGRELYGFDIPGQDKRVDLLLAGDDNWLKACTLYFIAEMNHRDHLKAVLPLVDDPDPVVCETSKYYLERIGISD
jgi:AAA family ATP:ADP antiporter